MKNFNTVYNNSRQQVLKERAAMYESQKVAIVKVLKENYMVTGNISDLPVEEQKQFAARLLEYWSPKTGIKKEGVKLLNENELTLSPASNLLAKALNKASTSLINPSAATLVSNPNASFVKIINSFLFICISPINIFL